MEDRNRNPERARALMAGFVLALAPFIGAAAAQPLDRSETTVDVAVGSSAPLTALSVTSGSVNCAQGNLVVGKSGKVGFLAPVIGPTVMRGSADSASAISWAVVSLDGSRDGLGGEALNAVTTCLAAR